MKPDFLSSPDSSAQRRSARPLAMQLCRGFGACCLALGLTAAVPVVRADDIVNISVKIICKPDGTRPSGGIADRLGVGGFDSEVNHGNAATYTGFGYQLNVVEFVDITPPVPAGQPASYWFSLYARGNGTKALVEQAALNDPVTWRWTDKAINIYVNDTTSGQCSFPNDSAIFLGKTVGVGTVVHEIGHFFRLSHTHTNDNNFIVGDWGDGDGLPETLPDDPDATLADINAHYPNETQQKRDDTYFNVMSYHEADRLLEAQIKVWTKAVHDYESRRAVLSPYRVYVGLNGSDTFGSGTPLSPWRTLPRAFDYIKVAPYQREPNFAVSIEGSQSSPPSYSVGPGINTRCRLEARGRLRIVP
jgi:hypothetical protein